MYTDVCVCVCVCVSSVESVMGVAAAGGTFSILLTGTLYLQVRHTLCSSDYFLIVVMFVNNI